MTVTAAMVKELRDSTGAGMMDAKKALTHFEAFTKSADGPLSRARAYYWLGRTYETLGDQAKARESYRTAATNIDTFVKLLRHAHGAVGGEAQLARGLLR